MHRWRPERLEELLDEWAAEAAVLLEVQAVERWAELERFVDGRSGRLPSLAYIFGLEPSEVVQAARSDLEAQIGPRILAWIRPAYGAADDPEADDAASTAAEKLAEWLTSPDDAPRELPPLPAKPRRPRRKPR